VLSLSDVGSHAAAGGDMRSSTNAGVGQPYTSDPLVANSRLAVKLGREARERRMEPLRRYRARQARFGSVSETIALRFLASRGRFIFSPERIGIPSPQKVERLISRASAMCCVRAPQCRAFATSRRISASRRSRACRNSRVARWGLTFLTYYRVGGGTISRSQPSPPGGRRRGGARAGPCYR
jgi:hypothetical protein